MPSTIIQPNGKIVIGSTGITRIGTPVATSVSNGLLTNLSSHWKLDASGLLVDSHGSNTLTNNGGVTTAAGIINEGADFESSSNQYLSVADADSLSMGAGVSISFSLWFKPESTAATNVLIDKFGPGGNEYLLYADMGSSRRLLFSIRGGGNVFHTTALNTGSWYLLVGSYNATTGAIALSVNGAAAETGTELTNPINGTSAFKIGSSDGGANYADGVIDEVSFWRGRVLSAGDITLLYNGGNGLPYSLY